MSLTKATFSMITGAPVNVLDYGAIGDGVFDCTQAFADAIAAVDAQGGGAIYIPDGIYMLDSLSLTNRSKLLLGESMGSVTLTHGVILRCRTACVDFVTVSGVAHQLKNLYIDGHGLASNSVVRYTGNTTDVVTSEVVISGGASGGYLLSLSANPVNPNAQIAELKFYGLYLAGSAGVKNLHINSDQTLVVSFYNAKSFSGDYGVYHVRGSVKFYNVFFTANLINDYYIDSGSLTIFGGRSESNPTYSGPITSIISANNSPAFVTLIDYIHATDAGIDCVAISTGSSGDWTFVGGQYVNIAISSVVANTTFIGVKNYNSGDIYGAGEPYAIRIQNNVVISPQFTISGGNRIFTAFAAPVSGTWTQGDIVFDTTPTAGGYIGWVCVTSGTPGTWKTFGAISP